MYRQGSSGSGAPPFPQSLSELLERQWEQGSHFLMEQSQHFDVAALLSCLYQLRQENEQVLPGEGWGGGGWTRVSVGG